MSKHYPLSTDEFRSFSPNPRTLTYLENLRSNLKIEKNEMNILDWGCGRGREVLWLRENGYNAFGVDIDSLPIENGIPLFFEKGYRDEPLRHLSPDSSTNFPSNYFHFTFSNQVLEHVANLATVSHELYRITKKHGEGLHIYPSQFYIKEGHLLMPFVHWSPKNRFRKAIIYAYLLIGKEPHWNNLQEKSLAEKVNSYYLYSINKTFYRSHTIVCKTFRESGFEVQFETINHPKITKNKLLSKAVQSDHIKKILNYIILTFKTVELRIIKEN